ncbi:MAG TPA: FAD-binding domain [Polyangiaceae bacterium]|jgi:2-polyprenyl-6-methoxyphenol hydroxylase-like FAD-dependent oxidoreductase
MKILVSGLGIAGPCVAYWLERHGHAVTIVERAPKLRTGGYVVDFWGAAFDVADRMGVASQILAKGYKVQELREVGRNGKRVSGLDVAVFDRLADGRFTSVARADVSAVLCAALGGRVETVFGDEIEALEDDGACVHVRFTRAPPRDFDLVIGADGLHSRVRRLAFGEHERFEHYLGLKVAAFAVEGYRPRDELTYVVHTGVGQQVARFAMRDDRTMFLFIFADATREIPDDPRAQRAMLRTHFEDSGWECRAILDALETSNELYIDRVSQIRMDRWTRGRVALVGDAAHCISLLGGQGTALAMIGAYILASEIDRAGDDHDRAFARYEQRLQDFIRAKQKGAARFASFFAPRSSTALFVRNQVMKLMAIPFVSNLAVGKEIRDTISLDEVI